MGEISYRQPPLAEVSFGLRFTRPPQLFSAHAGLFWSQIKDDFTETSDQPPIFDIPTLGQTTVQNLLPGFFPRVWFVHRAKAILIQIQSDRFLVNWRRMSTEVEYPRFEKLLPMFLDYVKSWVTFLDQQGVGQLKSTGYQLSYVNNIMPGNGWNGPAEVGRILKPFAENLQLPKQAQLQAISWGTILHSAVGKLTLALNTFQQASDTKQRMLQLELKSETLPTNDQLPDMANWFKEANVEIVSTFDSLATPWAQQELWHRVSSI